MNTDINAFLKRLENLKNGIALNDADGIELAWKKLKNWPVSALDNNTLVELSELFKMLERKDYGEAMELITTMRQPYSTLTKWTNPVIEGLRAEIQALIREINKTENDVADIEAVIHDFELRHNKELGDVILKILKLRSRLAAQKAKENPKDDTAKNEYTEARQEEEQFEGTYKEALKKPIKELSKEQLEELKRKFRKISKMSHPDVVDKVFEKEAAEIFMRAKQAKDENDLDTINEILEHLETGKPFTTRHEKLTEKDALLTESKRLRQVLKQLEKKKIALTSNETYQTITQIKDWNTYFIETKERLEKELKKLQKQIS